jgi:hypothetical protein
MMHTRVVSHLNLCHNLYHKWYGHTLNLIEILMQAHSSVLSFSRYTCINQNIWDCNYDGKRMSSGHQKLPNLKTDLNDPHYQYQLVSHQHPMKINYSTTSPHSYNYSLRP